MVFQHRQSCLSGGDEEMKVAIPSNEPRLDAHVEGELCRGKYVLIVDVNTMTYEPMANPIISLDGERNDCDGQWLQKIHERSEQRALRDTVQ